MLHVAEAVVRVVIRDIVVLGGLIQSGAGRGGLVFVLQPLDPFLGGGEALAAGDELGQLVGPIITRVTSFVQIPLEFSNTISGGIWTKTGGTTYHKWSDRRGRNTPRLGRLASISRLLLPARDTVFS